jgi:acetyl-CoA C-acetyltransferase
MKAVMLGHDQIMLGHAHAVIAGGMENMTLAPYLLDKARAGYRIGHHTVIDHMFFDGLEDAYHNNRLMGTFAEDTAEAYGFTREDQDNFARTSLERALHASHSHFFQSEIAPVEITSPKSSETIAIDETPTKVTPDKIAKLKPAFRTDGTVTAANSSSISDGAAALVLMSRSKAKELNIPPLAVIKGHATHAHQPEWFTTAPAFAIEKLCHKIGWSLNDVDLFEINEAFAVVTMAAMKDLNLPHEKVNIWGGACALGHPIGSSGARIIVTLIHSLIHTGGKRGIASLCIGGGEATAIAVELMG